MENENGERVIRRRKRIKTYFCKKVSIWVYPSEWDKLNYLASGAGKTVSRYIADKVLFYTGTSPEDVKREPSKNGQSRVLCFEENEYKIIDAKIKKSGQGVTQFLLNLSLGGN